MDWKEFWSNPEEMVMGGFAALAFAPFLKWWTVPAVLICAFLWRAGGTKGFDKLWRRLGVPLTLGAFLVLSHALTLLTAPLAGVLAFGSLSMGYGMPDPPDEGSALGRWWLKRVPDPVDATVLTRATVGCLFGLAWFPLGFVDVRWFWLAVSLLVLGFPTIERVVE